MKSMYHLGVLIAFFSQPALAQDTRQVALEQARARAVIDTLVSAETVAEAETHWLSLFFADDLDGRPGLTDSDRVIRKRIRHARIRADRVAQRLRYDLDRDLAVTRAEVLPFARGRALGPISGPGGQVAPNKAQSAQMVAQIMAEVFSADMSGDGILTLQEILDEPLTRYTAAGERADPARAPFAGLLDTNGDGTVTQTEFLVPLISGADLMDTNNDGTLSLIEKQQHSDRPVPRTARQKRDRAMHDALLPRPVCDLAPLSADAQVLVMGGYEGAALSNIEISKEGNTAYVVDLVISAGTRPLALVLAFRKPVILRLVGARDRLREVTTVGATYGLVNGPARPLLKMGSGSGSCDLNLWRAQPDDDTRETLRVWTGRKDVIIAADYTVGTVILGDTGAEVDGSLPGGHQPAFGSAAMQVWTEMLRYNPSGLIILEPDAVDTLGYAKFEPKVWPQQAGLAQLVDAGSLTPLADRSIQDMRMADRYGVVSIGTRKIRWDGGDDAVLEEGLIYTEETPGRWIGRAPALYRINEAITLPAGMYGAHMAEFLLPQGVPEPEGDRGHARLRPDD